MNESVDFKTQLRRGKYGEDKFMRYLRKIGLGFEDVSDKKEYQKKSIDFILENGKTVEVKTDYRLSETGNIVLEMRQNFDGIPSLGWFLKCEATELLIVDFYNEKGYLIPMKELKKLTEEKNFRRTTTRRFDGGSFSEATLILLPLKTLKGLLNIHEIQF